MPMPKPVCRANVYHKIVQLEVCRTFSGRGMGMHSIAHYCYRVIAIDILLCCNVDVHHMLLCCNVIMCITVIMLTFIAMNMLLLMLRCITVSTGCLASGRRDPHPRKQIGSGRKLPPTGVHVSLSLSLYIYIYMYTHTCRCTCMCICMCICTYVCVCIYIYIYIYTWVVEKRAAPRGQQGENAQTARRSGGICVYIYIYI